MELQIGKSYKLFKKIGSGAFGHIFEGYNINNETRVAIKLQSKKARKNVLFYEAKLLKYLLQVTFSL